MVLEVVTKTAGRSIHSYNRSVVVPRKGFESPLPFGKRILSPLRLPFRHLGFLGPVVRLGDSRGEDAVPEQGHLLSRGALMFSMRSSQLAWPMPWMVPGFQVQGWYRNRSYRSTGSCDAGSRSSSTVASYPLGRRASNSSWDAPKPARRMRCAIDAMLIPS